MLGKEEKQTDKGGQMVAEGGKKKRGWRQKRKDLKQPKKRKAMIYHWEGEVE